MDGGYRRYGFAFNIAGFGALAMGVFSLYVSGDIDQTSISVVKNVANNNGFKFIVVRESDLRTFSIYATGTYPSACNSYIHIQPIDNMTTVSIGNDVAVSSLTVYSSVEL